MYNEKQYIFGSMSSNPRTCLNIIIKVQILKKSIKQIYQIMIEKRILVKKSQT